MSQKDKIDLLLATALTVLGALITVPGFWAGQNEATQTALREQFDMIFDLVGDINNDRLVKSAKEKV